MRVSSEGVRVRVWSEGVECCPRVVAVGGEGVRWRYQATSSK